MHRVTSYGKLFVISLSVFFAALMWFARCFVRLRRFTCCSVATSALEADLTEETIQPTVVPRKTRTHPHTHTSTQFFPSLAKSGEQQKKPVVYVVGLTPLGIFFWKRVVCTCQLLLYKGVIYSRDHMQIPSAKHQRTDRGV